MENNIFDFYTEEGDILGANFLEVYNTNIIPHCLFFPTDIDRETIHNFKNSKKGRKNVIKLVRKVLNICGYDFTNNDVKEIGDVEVLKDSKNYITLTCIMLFLEKIGLRKASSLFLLALCRASHKDIEVKIEFTRTGIMQRWMGIFRYLSDVCPFTGLKYTGNSCYQDSVLLCLFGIPNYYIDRNILAKNIKELSYNDKREIKCSENKRDDYKFRKSIQDELNRITLSIRGMKNIEYCSELRRLLKNCPSFGGQKFYKTDTQDAGEFLQYIFSLFEVEGIVLEKTSYITNDIETGKVKKMKLSRNVVEKISPIFMVQSGFSESPIYLRDQINTVEDTIFDKRNLLKGSDGELYRRKVEKTVIKKADYLIFYDNRLGIGGRTTNKIIPEETLEVGEKTLSLYSVVVHRNVHYTAYIKCNNKWYYYNDLSGMKGLEWDFRELLDKSSPNICTEGVLYFYS